MSIALNNEYNLESGRSLNRFPNCLSCLHTKALQSFHSRTLLVDNICFSPGPGLLLIGSLPHPSHPLSHLLTDSTALPLRLWSRRPSSCASFGPVQYRISGTHDRCYLMMMMIIIGQPSCDELFPVPRSGLSALIKPSSSSAELPLPRKPRAQQRGGSCET